MVSPDVRAFEKKHNVLLVRKDKDPLMWLIGKFSKRFRRFVTTYRLPGMKRPHICIPNGPIWFAPLSFKRLLKHELVHAVDFAKWWGPFFMALAIVPPGRWLVERYAYLTDIKSGRLPIARAVDKLWIDYGIKSFGFPSRKYMTKWFEARRK
jgi:hypothetical protein